MDIPDDQSGDDRRPFDFRTMVYMVVGVVALFIVCCTVLVALDKDIAPLLQVGYLMVVPLIGLFGAKGYQSIKQSLDGINVNVNGRLSTLVDHAMNSVPLDKTDKVEVSK